MNVQDRSVQRFGRNSAHQKLRDLQSGGTIWTEPFSQETGKFYCTLAGTSFVRWSEPRRGTIVRYAVNAGARHHVHWPHSPVAPWEWNLPESEDEDDEQEWIPVAAVSSRSNSALSLAPNEVEDPFGDEHSFTMFLPHVRNNTSTIPVAWSQTSRSQRPQAVNNNNNLPNSNHIDGDDDDRMSVEASAVSIQGSISFVEIQEEGTFVDLAAGITPRRKRRWVKWGSIVLGVGIAALSAGRRLFGQRI